MDPAVIASEAPGPDRPPMSLQDPVLLDAEGLAQLVRVLRARGYLVVGPTVRDGAVVYDTISDIRDLPVGWFDDQAPAYYRLGRGAEQTRFAHVVGPHSWKRYLHPPQLTLWRARRAGAKVDLAPPDEAPPAYAFLGVRACELAAIHVQDRVFLDGRFTDPAYRARRTAAFIVGVNCTRAGGTCFCASMGTGPAVPQGYDLALTELADEAGVRYLCVAGTERGAAIRAELPARAASPEDVAAGAAAVARAAGSMGRTVELPGLAEILANNPEHPRWEEVAHRCLGCANCTFVCPTCFCVTVEDSTDLTGGVIERRRVWDSCFTVDFSYVHGGSVRPSPRGRYRQWLTHKLSSWHDQFGTCGCVGCGRCITWCPAAIDITQEIEAIRATAAPSRRASRRSTYGSP